MLVYNVQIKKGKMVNGLSLYHTFALSDPSKGFLQIKSAFIHSHIHLQADGRGLAGAKCLLSRNTNTHIHTLIDQPSRINSEFRLLKISDL